MNTIGKVKNENDKLEMSLDEIIAREPLRYTCSEKDKNSMKIYRSKHYGNNRQEPYAPRNPKAGQKNVDNWSHYTPSRPAMSRCHNAECPYMFKYNGVYVSESSPLLNRQTGDVEAILKDEVNGCSGHDSEEEDEAGKVLRCSHGHPVKTPAEQKGVEYDDLGNPKLPVHQRLGIPSSQGVKKRLRLHGRAARQHPTQNKLKVSDPLGIRSKQNSVTKSKRKHNSRNGMKRPNTNGAVTISFKNDLATGLSSNQHGIRSSMFPRAGGTAASFPTALTRQNVAQLPSVLGSAGPASLMSSASRTNEDLLSERLAKCESMLQQVVAASTTSVVSGYLPLSQQMAVNGMPVMGGAVSLVQQPVAMMLPTMGVPMVGGTSASVSPQQQQQPGLQGRVVVSSTDGMLVVHSTPPGPRTSEAARIGRQLTIAANRQPLDDTIQNCISASQAALMCAPNSFSRLPQESFNYQPVPHTTATTINSRITNHGP